MARVSPTEVRQIMDNCTLDDPTVNAYITGAHAFVDSVLSGQSIDTTLLKEIERWFCAHMIACSSQRQGLIEKLGDAAITYVGKYGDKLDSTSYGQMVKTLDVTGKMANSGKASATMYAIPENEEDE